MNDILSLFKTSWKFENRFYSKTTNNS